MLFHVRMDVHIPHGADSKHVDKLRSDEKARAQQTAARWHLAPLMADRRRVRQHQHLRRRELR